MKKVSIIIPFFNGQDYIAQAVESVRKQSYSNIEIILINNCSTDNSERIVRSVAANDKRFVFVNEPEKGIANALNSGIKKSSGDIITFLDQDDIYHEDRVFKMVEKMEDKSSDFIACRGIKINPAGMKIGETDSYLLSSSVLPIVLMRGNIVSSLSYFTIKRSLLKKYLPLPVKYSNMIDYYLLMKLIRNKDKIFFADDLLVKRRYHSSNTSLDMYTKAQQTVPALIEFYESCTDVNKFYSKVNVKKIITERYINGVQYLRRQNRYEEIIGFQEEYVDLDYIYRAFYLYFSGISILKVDKSLFKVFIKDNELDHPFYFYILGLFYYDQSNYIEATKCFEKAIKESGIIFPEAMNSLALSQFYQNKDKAVNTLQKLINKNPQYKDPYLNLNYIINDQIQNFVHSVLAPHTLLNFMIIYKEKIN